MFIGRMVKKRFRYKTCSLISSKMYTVFVAVACNIFTKKWKLNQKHTLGTIVFTHTHTYYLHSGSIEGRKKKASSRDLKI